MTFPRRALLITLGVALALFGAAQLTSGRSTQKWRALGQQAHSELPVTARRELSNRDEKAPVPRASSAEPLTTASVGIQPPQESSAAPERRA